jgi:hypothetical protein
MPRTPILIMLALAVGSCTGSSRLNQAAPWESVIGRFIAADTSGNVAAADSLADWSACQWVPSADFVEPVGAAERVGARQVGDTVLVHVRYQVLGVSTGAVFHAKASDDTVTVPILRLSDGTYRIQCGDFHPNHPGISAFERGWLPALDSAARDEWRRARQGAVSPSTH